MDPKLLSIALIPRTAADWDRLRRGLAVLGAEDPALGVSDGPDPQSLLLSGMGEQHLAIAIERLKREYDVSATIGRPEVICRSASQELPDGRVVRRMLEPLMRVEVVVHHDDEAVAVESLAGRDATVVSVESRGDMRLILARVRLSQMFGYAVDLRERTRGRGSFQMQLHGYTPLR